MYETNVKLVKAELRKAKSIVIGFDGWTATFTKRAGLTPSFVGVLATYYTIDSPGGGQMLSHAEMELKHTTLAVQHLPRPHTSERIYQLLKDTLGLYGIPLEKIAAVLTDGAATERCAAQMLSSDIKLQHARTSELERSVVCICHTIDLAVKDALATEAEGVREWLSECEWVRS